MIAMRTRATLAWSLLIAASLASQEAKDAVSAPPRLERSQWVEQFCGRLDALGPEAAAADAEIVRLVTAYSWHAVPQAIQWLDATDPVAERKQDGATPEVLRARVQPIAHVLAREHTAPGLEEIFDRMIGWTADDWQAYRDARGLQAEANALYEKYDWAGAEPPMLSG